MAVPGAVGIERRILTDPNDLQATWGALDQRWLLALTAGPAAMAGLLASWREHLAGREMPAGPDSAAIVVWPSRDLAMTPVFVAHGLIPDLVIAVRLAGRHPAAAASAAAVQVRRASAADLDAVVALRMEEVRFGTQLSALPPRLNTTALIRDRYTAALAVAAAPVAYVDCVPGGRSARRAESTSLPAARGHHGHTQNVEWRPWRVAAHTGS